jgi:hypothetical protein
MDQPPQQAVLSHGNRSAWPTGTCAWSALNADAAPSLGPYELVSSPLNCKDPQLG